MINKVEGFPKVYKKTSSSITHDSQKRKASMCLVRKITGSYNTCCSPDLAFSRPISTSLGLEPRSLGLGLGTWDHENSVFVTH